MNRDKSGCKCAGLVRCEISAGPGCLGWVSVSVIASRYFDFWLSRVWTAGLGWGYIGVTRIVPTHSHGRGMSAWCELLSSVSRSQDLEHSSHASLPLTIRTFLLRRGILLLWVLQFGGGERSSFGQVCQLFVSPKKLQHRRKDFNYWQFAPSRRKG